MPEFNPQKIEKIAITLRLEESTIEKLDKLSIKRDLSRNELMVQCIDFALKHIIDDEEKENKL
ncbi:MAG: ribbon-helix-helix domain-containing protein [Oscillospiraceae bacterium]|nr:ribbon-helix-helix domain-containing protein [Oscillospiraceae bacterium]